MTTISALELRKNMDSYLKRAAQGESFKVSYRGKSLAVLQGDQSAATSNANAFLKSAQMFRSSLSGRLTTATDQEIQAMKDTHIMEKYGG